MQSYLLNSVKKLKWTQIKKPPLRKWQIISLFPLLLASCATEEEIKRRETLKRLNIEMSGQQKIVKGLLLATQRIEKSLGTVSGKIEDNQYQENISLESTVNGLS